MSGRRGAPVSILLCAVLAPAFFPAAGLHAGEKKKEPSAPDDSACELKIHGNSIEKLVLLRDRGRGEVLNNPAASVRLPAGTYRVGNVQLKGGYQCWDRDRAKLEKPFTLTPEAPGEIKVGGPLASSVKVTRRARVLELTYQLLDVGGREVRGTSRGDPPKFVIYNGDRQIASGAFEYG
jgi:hypothetical protein